MRPTVGVLLLGVLLAGGAGAGMALFLAPSPPPTAPPVPRDRLDLGPLDRRLDRIEERLASLEDRPPAARGVPAAPAPTGTGAADGAAPPDAAPKREAPATMAEVRAYLAAKLKEDGEEGDHGFRVSVGDRGDLSLAEVAKGLGIEDYKVARIRDLYRQEGEDQLKAVFGTDDIESIRRRIRDAREDPAKMTGLQEALLSNLMTSLPSLRRAETAKAAALKDLLGSATYDRFRKKPVNEAETDEFDALLGDALGTAGKPTGTDAK